MTDEIKALREQRRLVKPLPCLSVMHRNRNFLSGLHSQPFRGYPQVNPQKEWATFPAL